jgi:hypothetical protein
MKAATLVIAVILTLATFGVAGAQDGPSVYVNVNEILGLTADMRIPVGGTTLRIPVRYQNVDEARTYITNGYKIVTDNVTIGSVTGEWNPDYPWDWPHAINLGIFPPYFDQGLFINYFTGGLAFVGLTGAQGSGLPADFDDIACYITINDVDGGPCGSLTLDSITFMEPSTHAWCWGGLIFPTECLVSPEWGGPYQLFVEGAPCGQPPVLFLPPCEYAEVGELYTCDIDADGDPPIAFALVTAPSGMTIDPVTGIITWIPTEPGSYMVCVIASNPFGSHEQCFVVTVMDPTPVYTTCWPQPTLMFFGHLLSDDVLNIIIWNEQNDQVILESILVQGKLEPYTEARIEGDSIVTDVFLRRFIGLSKWRPIPSEGIMSTYTVEYDKVDGSHVVLTGEYVLGYYQGDVNLDGEVNDDDLRAMRDYLFNRGEPGEFEEFMDVDGNGQIDLRDMRELIKIIEGN